MIKKTFYYSQLIIILSLFWIVLFENTSLSNIVIAPIVSIVVLFISEKYLLKTTYFKLFPFNIFKLLRYTFFLFIEIFKSGLSIIPSILTGNVNPMFVEINTDLESNLDIVILANSITLTPGTITVDLESNRLLILWMNATTTSSLEAGALIKGKIEKMIRRGL